MQNKLQDRIFDNRAIFRLVWPILVELGLNTAIGLVNSVMVSSMGMYAISAVSLVDSINLLFLNVFNALAAGVTVVVSHCRGRNDKRGGDAALTQTFSIMVFIAALAGGLLLAFNRPVLGFMFGKVEQDVMDSSVTYCVGSAIGYPFIAAYAICAGALRATGDSRTPMVAALISNIVNIAVGALTIFGLDMGMAGASLAVLSARVTAAVVVFIKVAFRPGVVNLTKFTLKIDRKIFGPVIQVGIPAGIDSLIFNAGKLVVTSFLAGMGTDAIAANSITGMIFNFALVTGNAFSNAGVTITGRCYGAGHFDEAKIHLRRLPVISSVVYGIAMVGLWFAVPGILALYQATPQAAAYVTQIVRINMLAGTVTWSAAFVLPNCLRGVGDINFNTVVSVTSMWIFRVGLAYVLGVWLNMSVLGVWLAMFADWTARAVCFTWRMLSNRWYKKAMKQHETPQTPAPA